MNTFEKKWKIQTNTDKFDIIPLAKKTNNQSTSMMN